MRDERRDSRQPALTASRRRTPSRGAGVPAELSRRFAEFRRAAGGGTRIPDDLRQAVLRALDRGVPMVALCRELGLTAQQVSRWPRDAFAVPREDQSAASARVFDVVDSSTEEVRAVDSLAGAGAAEELELRLGGWSLVIRPMDRS